MEQSSPVLSVIICSIDPARADATVENIKSTAGIECEFIVVDNRQRKWPIAKVYNFGAGQASAPYLFFVHEDVLFETEGWGKPVTDKLAEKETGVIGFIGSTVRTAAYSPWCQGNEYAIGHLYYNDNGFREIIHQGVRIGEVFRPVLVVDGLGMFVARDVWREYPFDEVMLTGFHCYDIDFCLAISQTHTNYVYFGADVCHYSNGSYNLSWAETTIDLTDRKWAGMLPAGVEEEGSVDFDEVKSRMDYDFLRTAIRTPSVYPKSLVKKLLRRYVKLSAGDGKYRSHLFAILWQYGIKRLGKTGR